MASYDGSTVAQETVCFHCGEAVGDGGVVHEEKAFCCAGCKLVYEILQGNSLSEYYALLKGAGVSPSFSGDDRFAYLDEPAVAVKILDFSDDCLSCATLAVPMMHCSSCVWLLENLHRLNPGIVQSRVDFLRKTIHVRFTPRTTIRRVVELLASLGYTPEIILESAERRPAGERKRPLYSRIGVAGFCFANIMLLSLPEYLSGGRVDPLLAGVFRYVALALSLPVFLFSSSEYFRSTLAGLSRRIINLDVPIALGILILFLRSVYDILAGSGPGYLDSMTGLVFFLLIGKLFQQKTYDTLNFERDYTSYFPLAVTVRRHGEEVTVPVSRLAVGDRMIIRNCGIVPADAIILSGRGTIDYSFVTGESRLVPKEVGELVYAGGRQTGGALELEVLRQVSQSYLTQLWNQNSSTRAQEGRLTSVSNTIAKYFTGGILVLAAMAAVLWLPHDPDRALNAVTGVLIVACPCALALSTPFTFGSALRIFGRQGFYLKDASVVERLARITTVVLDKTGTITHAGQSAVRFVGEVLSPMENDAVASVVRASAHPLSRAVFAALRSGARYEVTGFTEEPNQGVAGDVRGISVRIGGRDFVGAGRTVSGDGLLETRVYLALDGNVRGYFAVTNCYRNGLDQVIAALGSRYKLVLLSGDNEGERRHLAERFPRLLALHFDQSPVDKLTFIRSLRERGERVMMLGDGLNDAGALRESDVGVSIAEDTAAFTPSSDVILDSAGFCQLPAFLRLSKRSILIVVASFAISFLYNLGGLTYAFRGELSPLIAAILMPLSSITVVLLSTIWIRLAARRKGLLPCQ